MTRTRLLTALVLLAALGASGCRREEPAPSVDELAAALRAHGVAFTVEETAALPRLRAQGLRLTGPELEVEVYRIDDEKQMALAATAAQMAQAAGATTAGARPLQACVSSPFLVIVRREPAAGQVAAALAQALPR
jgi:hypothetical protein